MRLLHLLTVLSTATLLHASCPDPIVLPIQNTTLHTGITVRGVPLTIGNQQFSLQPRNSYHNLFIQRNLSNCGTQLHCIALGGGAFDPSVSSTWQPAIDVNAANGSSWQLSTSDLTKVNWGDDAVKLMGTSIPHMPVALDFPHLIREMGLSSHSSFLSALLAGNSIPSRSFGLDYGDTLRGSRDGSLVLGGYDAAKTTGVGVTMPLSGAPWCFDGNIVEITELRAVVGGVEVDLLAAANLSSIPTCVDTGSDRIVDAPAEGMQFPSALYNATRQAFGLGLDNFYVDTIPTNASLSITFQDKVQFTLPRDSLFYRRTNYDSAGQQVLEPANMTRFAVSKTGDEVETNASYLGGPIWDFVYLMTNHEKHELTLWNLNRTTEQRIVPISGGNSSCPSEDSSGRSGSTPATGDSSSTAPPGGTAVQKSTSGPSPGVIAAIAAGGTLLLALLVLVAFCLIRRKRRQSNASRRLMYMSDVNGSDYERKSTLLHMRSIDRGPLTAVSEVSGEGSAIRELQSTAIREVWGGTPGKEMSGRSPALKETWGGSSGGERFELPAESERGVSKWPHELGSIEK